MTTFQCCHCGCTWNQGPTRNFNPNLFCWNCAEPALRAKLAEAEEQLIQMDKVILAAREAALWWAWQLLGPEDVRWMRPGDTWDWECFLSAGIADLARGEEP